MAALEQDTIVAISTPAGRGGIGVVRLSGPRAREAAAPLLRLQHELAAGRARFGELVEVEGSSFRDGIKKNKYGDSSPVAQNDNPSSSPAAQNDNSSSSPAAQNDNPSPSPSAQNDNSSSSHAAQNDNSSSSPAAQNDNSNSSHAAQNDNSSSSHAAQNDNPSPSPAAQNDNSNSDPEVLDQVVVTYFAAPNSYTGEDVVEIAAHGAPVLLEYIVRQCCAGAGRDGGVRLAEPGEFTQRAFLAGRIDLTQAEAVGDLIGSSTLEQARVAARQLGGALARVVAPAKAELVQLIAAMEAGIDFAEDDIDVLPAEKIAGDIAAVRAPLERLERSFAYGRVVREGFRLAIVGRPNAGKSSLFNRLVERERAIVTATPGTTRDLVTETVAIDGIPVELVDTAGLRNHEDIDEAERLGVAKAYEAMADADVVLLVVDAAAGEMSGEDRAVLERCAAGGSAMLVAWNKWDLVQVGAGGEMETHVSEARRGAPGSAAGRGALRTSAVTGEGIAELRAAIVAAVAGADAGGLREAGMLTSLRQHQAVAAALSGLDAASAAMAAQVPHEMVLLDLYQALGGLDALTGATTTEDVLRLIFSQFCIGK